MDDKTGQQIRQNETVLCPKLRHSFRSPQVLITASTGRVQAYERNNNK